MEFSELALNEFKFIYKKHFGKTISNEKATLDGLMLIKLVSKIQPNMKDMDKTNDEKSASRTIHIRS